MRQDSRTQEKRKKRKEKKGNASRNLGSDSVRKAPDPVQTRDAKKRNRVRNTEGKRSHFVKNYRKERPNSRARARGESVVTFAYMGRG